MARKKISKSIKDYLSFVSILIAAISVGLVFYTFGLTIFKMVNTKHNEMPVFHIASPKLNLEKRTLTFNFWNTNENIGSSAFVYVWLVTSTGEFISIGKGSGPYVTGLEDYAVDFPYYIWGQHIGTFSGRFNGEFKLDLIRSLVIRMSYAIIGENPVWHEFTEGYIYIPPLNTFTLMPSDQLDKTLKHWYRMD